MKKGILFLIVLLSLGCRNSDDNPQKIDQKLHLYIDDGGVDMLQKTNPKAYQALKFNDVYGETETAPVSFSKKVDEDSIYYLQYIAGATRQLLNESDGDKTYESKIALELTTVENDQNIIINDTLTLQYEYTPSLFKLNKVMYNGEEKVIQEAEGFHIVKIYKNP